MTKTTKGTEYAAEDGGKLMLDRSTAGWEVTVQAHRLTRLITTTGNAYETRVTLSNEQLQDLAEDLADRGFTAPSPAPDDTEPDTAPAEPRFGLIPGETISPEAIAGVWARFSAHALQGGREREDDREGEGGPEYTPSQLERTGVATALLEQDVLPMDVPALAEYILTGRFQCEGCQ